MFFSHCSGGGDSNMFMSTLEVQVDSLTIDRTGFFLTKENKRSGNSIIQHWGTRWWFQIFFLFFIPILEMIQFDDHIFQMGWNHQLANSVFSSVWVSPTLIQSLFRQFLVVISTYFVFKFSAPKKGLATCRFPFYSYVSNCVAQPPARIFSRSERNKNTPNFTGWSSLIFRGDVTKGLSGCQFLTNSNKNKD